MSNWTSNWTSTDWTIYVVIGAAFMILWRLDRLGKQLEAICANIKEELTPDEDRKHEILSEWMESKKQQTKDNLQFWIFWGIVGATIIAWNIISRN